MDKVFVYTHDMSIGYRREKPLAVHLDLQLRPGQTVSLIGGNGIGKSTLIRTLAGDLRPLSGEIHVMGRPMTRTPRRTLATLISLVDTSTGLFGGLTVHQLVELGRQPYTGLLGILSANDKAICTRAMEATGIAHKANCHMGSLSDGERQKAMIARALAQDTPVIYLDEPFSFLDPSARIEVMDMLCRIARNQEKAILLTCHDVALSLRMANRLWLFSRDGQVADMTPDQATGSGMLDSLYDSECVRFSSELGDFVIKE